MVESLRVPISYVDRVVRRARVVALALGLVAFVVLGRSPLSGEQMAMGMLAIIVVAVALFFGPLLFAQEQGRKRRDALIDSLGLTAEGGRFVGVVDGVRVVIGFRRSTGTSWEVDELRHRSVTTLDATYVLVGHGENLRPPAELEALGVKRVESEGAWRWEGQGDVLTDPNAAAFVRCLVIARLAEPSRVGG